MTPKEVFKTSIENRHNFLEQKKREWVECKSDRKKKKIIVELIQLEPSHLAEDWILDQVIKWMKEPDMKEREKNIDYLKSAFIAHGLRDEITEKQRENLAKACFIDHKIKKMSREEKISQMDAIRKWAVFSEDDTLPDEPETAIKQRLKRYRKALDKRALPFPYYGKDVIEIDRGNEHHRIEFLTFNKPGEVAGQALFGDTKISMPVKKKPTK
jgi:hypothetical protein